MRWSQNHRRPVRGAVVRGEPDDGRRHRGTSGTGNNTLTTMLLAARAMRAWVAPTMVSVPGSREAFDEGGLAHNATFNQRLRMLGAEVARASAMFATYWSAG